MATIKSALLATLLASRVLADQNHDNLKHIILPRQASPTPSSSTSFSSTAVQVPIATVCPAGGNKNAFSNASASSTVSATAKMPNGSTTTFASLVMRETPATGMPSPATVLPDGVTALPLMQNSLAARVVVGPDGCQTLYAPTTTAICSTVVTPGGMPPVRITDCDQYITFSSEVLLSCAPTSEVTPRPLNPSTSAMNNRLGNVDGSFAADLSSSDTTSTSTTGEGLDSVNSAIHVKRQILFSKGMPVETDLATVTPAAPIASLKYKRDNIIVQRDATTPAEAASEVEKADIFNSTSDTTTSKQTGTNTALNGTLLADSAGRLANLPGMDLDAKIAQLSSPAPTKYYAAPWYEIAQGGVPSRVRGITCYGGAEPIGDCDSPDGDGDTEQCECSTVNEAWSVTTITRTRVGNTVVSFSGPLVLTFGSLTRTTSINFRTTTTTTATNLYPSVAHTTLGPIVRPSRQASAANRLNDVAFEPTITDTLTSMPTATISLLPGDPEISPANMAAAPQASPEVTSTPDPEEGSLGNLPPIDSEDFTSSVTTIPIEAQDLPTTILDTSTVTTETVTVPGSSDAAESAAPMAKRQETWPADVWAANLAENFQNVNKETDTAGAAGATSELENLVPRPVLEGLDGILPAIPMGKN